MNMKDHILSALKEQFENWNQLLGSMSEEKITVSRFDLDWSIKDIIAHLWGWQQISSARMEGGLHDQEPKFPGWVAELQADWEVNADHTNAMIYKANHLLPWSKVYLNWREGFLRFLELGERMSEKDLLDGNRYAWLNGYSLAQILLASYDHHQEHLEKLRNLR
jgi:hypothetical protein